MSTDNDAAELNPYFEDKDGLKYDPNPSAPRFCGDNGIQAGDSWPWWTRVLCGILLTVNFMVFFGLPVFLQGFIYTEVFAKYLRPIYDRIDQSKVLRDFAIKYVYTRPVHAEYFFSSILAFLGFIIPFLYILTAQMSNGTITWTQLIIYYFGWVGIAGACLGNNYALMHKEAHVQHFYKPAIQNTVGNFFENVTGPFYGNVPYNFSTTHIYLHHPTQGHSADSFYQLDVDRSSWTDFMVFVHRIFLHMSAFTAYNQMRLKGFHKQCAILLKGMVMYYVLYPFVLYMLTKSLFFVLMVYFNCMIGFSFFLAQMNICLHAFFVVDEQGNPVEEASLVNIINSDDPLADFFGEAYHGSHHYATQVQWKDLEKDAQENHIDRYRRYQGAVFKNMSIPEVSMLLLLKKWDLLADKFVQFNEAPAKDKKSTAELVKLSKQDLQNGLKPDAWIGQGLLTKEEVMAMLEQRAKRREPKWLRY